ncbi:MAG: YwaF family protein [Eubacteriales bacterium]|nr:YwaF family protein [Eubacteriales bacterium]
MNNTKNTTLLNKCASAAAHFGQLSDRTADKLLFCCGLLLAASELYKQIFLYVVINGGHYDWWFFPFQLCSLPMYLCLLIPFLKDRKVRVSLCTFMQDYGLLGGIAALMVPDGFSNIHWTLTLHGYLWHLLLIVIGCFLGLSGRTDTSRMGFVRTIPVFLSSCFVATLINLLAPGHGRADMFYISPYYPNTQLLFHSLSLRLGILPGNLLYIGAVCLGGYLVHQLFRWLLHKLSCSM